MGPKMKHITQVTGKMLLGCNHPLSKQKKATTAENKGNNILSYMVKAVWYVPSEEFELTANTLQAHMKPHG